MNIFNSPHTRSKIQAKTDTTYRETNSEFVVAQQQCDSATLIKLILIIIIILILIVILLLLIIIFTFLSYNI